MRTAFKSQPPVHADDLMRCLESCLRREQTKFNDFEDDDYSGWREDFEKAYVLKLFWLIDQLYDLPGGKPHAIDTVVTLVTTILRFAAKLGTSFRLSAREFATAVPTVTPRRPKIPNASPRIFT